MPTKNYVLIIDEISRGHIPEIFCELITLIEQNKRLGNKEALTIQLPISKEWFSVPNNVYIIGTSGVAGKYIIPMDNVIRRRFNFIEMHPRPYLLQTKVIQLPNGEKEINLCNLLTIMNERIEMILDKEHCIGHSHFMGEIKNINDLKRLFQYKIIPLLQDYLFNNDKQLFVIIGGGFFESKNTSPHSGLARIENSITNKWKEEYMKTITLRDLHAMKNDAFMDALQVLIKR